MEILHVVLDTNVLVAGLRSRNGASFQLLSQIGPDSGFEIHLSVALVLEYEAVLRRADSVPPCSSSVNTRSTMRRSRSPDPVSVKHAW